MLESLFQTLCSYSDFYCRLVIREWNHMTPVKYGTLLISIGLVGWLMMKNQPKR